MTSEALFDNNLYAFSLEFALPEIFTTDGTSGSNAKLYMQYLENIRKNRKNIADYQSQNIALAFLCSVRMKTTSSRNKLKCI